MNRTPLLLALLALGAVAAASPTLIPPRDFIEYWAAARVHLRGGDPYDGAQVLPFQREATGDPDKTDTTSLWTPPWTLPLYWPIGALPPREGHIVWLGLNLLMVIASGLFLWNVFDGSPRFRVLGAVIAVLFGPSLWNVIFAQNTGFLIFGLAGFLLLWKRGWYVAAGAVGALTAIKPHLLALFGLAMALGVFDSRGRKVLLGGILALAVASGLACIPNPEVFPQFVAAVGKPKTAETVPLSDWMVPTISYRLRAWLAPETFAVQFVPVLIAAVGLLPYCFLRRRTWDWTVEAPRLVLASVILAPYGAWIFDLTVLLVPVLLAFAMAISTRRLIPIAVAVAGHASLSLLTFTIEGLHESIWFAPAVLLWFATVLVLSRRSG